MIVVAVSGLVRNTSVIIGRVSRILCDTILSTKYIGQLITLGKITTIITDKATYNKQANELRRAKN